MDVESRTFELRIDGLVDHYTLGYNV